MFGTIWRESNKTMKTLTVNSSKIVYQILPTPEDLKEDHIVIILKRRSRDRKIYEGSVELISEAGKAPSVEALNEAVRQRLQIDQPIKIMKYVNHDFEWVEVSKENIEKLTKKKKAKPQKKDKGNQQPQKGKKETEKKEGEKK